MPLDSDVHNADSMLDVKFYERDTDPNKGDIYIRIISPGSKDIYDQPAREHHKLRFQRHWLHFQGSNGASQLIGQPLFGWHQERPAEFTEGQLHELTLLKFQTVEQVAMASDAQMLRVGMGGAGLRQRAQVYLASKNAMVAGAEMQNHKSQIDAQQTQIEELKAMLANLTKMGAAQPLQAARKSKRGGYRPRKNKVPVNVQHDDGTTSAAGGQ